MVRRTLTHLLAAGLFFVFSNSGALQKEGLEEKIKSKQIELEELKRQIEQNRQEIERLKGKEGEIGSQIHRAEKQIDLLKRYIRGLRSQERRLERSIRRETAALRKAQRELSLHERDFAERLRRIYKHGRLRYTEVLLSARSFPDLLKRYKYLSLIERQDKADMEKIMQERDRLREHKSRLEARLKQKLDIRKEKSRQERLLKKEKAEKERLLATVQGDRKLAEKVNRELQAATEEIQLTIRRLLAEAEKREAREEAEGIISSYDFARRKGALRWPLDGPLIAKFGRYKDKRLKTWTFNRGIDIRTPVGTDVRAVAPGRVMLADWFRGYGRFLLVYHNDGYFTLYAHLSEILVDKGDEVQAGEVLARSGDTGSLDGPKLHFEVLKGTEALDPVEWLSKK